MTSCKSCHVISAASCAALCCLAGPLAAEAAARRTASYPLCWRAACPQLHHLDVPAVNLQHYIPAALSSPALATALNKPGLPPAPHVSAAAQLAPQVPARGLAVRLLQLQVCRLFSSIHFHLFRLTGGSEGMAGTLAAASLPLCRGGGGSAAVPVRRTLHHATSAGTCGCAQCG